MSAANDCREEDAAFRSAYFDLEEPIRDLMHMANISAAMAIELIGNVGEQNDQNMRLLPIEADKHERLLFVISQTGRMADELYLAFPRREARR